MIPILILHGWGSSSNNWSRVKELLGGYGYRVFLPDLPGFGESSPPLRPWSIDDYVDWVRDYCEKENISQFFLLGHSFGGTIALKYSLKFPQRVKGLFLIASAAIRRRTIKKEIMRIIAVFFKAFSFLPFYPLIRKAVYRVIIRKSDYPYAQGIMKETYLRVVKENLANDLSGVSVPTTIIWGEKDDVVPLKDAYFMEEEIRGSNLVIIPGANHDLERKNPEVLAEKIKEFLR